MLAPAICLAIYGPVAAADLPFESEQQCVNTCVSKCLSRSKNNSDTCFKQCAERPEVFKNPLGVWMRHPSYNKLQTSLDLHNLVFKICESFGRSTDEDPTSTSNYVPPELKLLATAKEARQLLEQQVEKSDRLTQHLVKEVDELVATDGSETLLKAEQAVNKLLKQKGLDTHTKAPSLSCILASQKNKGDWACPEGKRTFRSCMPGNPRHDLPSYVMPLCRTESNTKLVHQSFHDAANCMGLTDEERKQLFMLFNHESNFVNAESCTNARCFGQLTSVSLANSHSKILNILNKNKTKPECYRVNMYFEKLKYASRYMNNRPNGCTLIQNPYSCFMYSMYEYRHAQNLARESVTRFNATHDMTLMEALFLDSKNMDQEDVINTVALWSYNAGAGLMGGRLRNVFSSLLDSIDRAGAIIQKLFPAYAECMRKEEKNCEDKHISMGSFVNGFRKFLEADSYVQKIDAPRRREVLKFFSAVINSSKYLRRRQPWLSEDEYNSCLPDLHKKVTGRL